MPTGLKRYYGSGDLHYITRSCYQRKRWLDTTPRGNLLLKILEDVRREQCFVVLGYVVMPEHFHLLMSEPQVGNPSTVMQSMKQRFAQRMVQRRRRRNGDAQGVLWKTGSVPVWQPRFNDFNVWTEHKRAEKLRYMHRNPVKRGLVEEPDHWLWSSYRFYKYGEAGTVRINDAEIMRLNLRPPA